MANKRRKSKAREAGRRAPSQRKRRNSDLKTYGLIVGAIVLAVVAIVILVLLDQGGSRSQAQAEASASAKSVGAQDAPVVVVEYADFQCPYCRQFAEGAERQLRADYVDKRQVRFVFRHLAFIGDESLWAAEASECAGEQNRFWEYHDKLFAEQRGENTGTFSRNNLKRFAADLGLDTAQFNQCLDSNKYWNLVQQEGNDAKRLGISSTPSVSVNGRLIKDGSSYQVLQAAIDAALNK
jgi:protein-disulfide isomerase